MPLYDYDCAACGGFDCLRPSSQRDEPLACPGCGADAARVFGGAPRLALLAGSTRAALDVNERARHEPHRSGSYQRMKHPSGCGCCKPGQRGATVTAANGAKGFPSKRPWMISH